MADRPTIYLTNAASRKPPHRGPSRVWTIMARPNAGFGQAGLGPVPLLVPKWKWVDNVRQGLWPMDRYRSLYVDALQRLTFALEPGRLTAVSRDPTRDESDQVQGGDTLICCCSRAKAAKGECHRVWAAEVLASCGWRVVLDGRELNPPSETPCG